MVRQSAGTVNGTVPVRTAQGRQARPWPRIRIRHGGRGGRDSEKRHEGWQARRHESTRGQCGFNNVCRGHKGVSVGGSVKWHRWQCAFRWRRETAQVAVHVPEACRSSKKGRQFEGMVNDRFADYGVVLGVDLFAVRIHFLLIELGKVEEMTGLGLVLPRLACTSLIQKQGLLALSDDLVFMVLNLPEGGGEDLGVALGPACWGEPCVKARAIGCSCSEGEAVIAGFGDVPEVFIGGLS